MTDEELIKAVVAEVMGGWQAQATHPNDYDVYYIPKIGTIRFDLANANHWMKVVERMRELGYWVYIQGPDNSEIEWHCKFNPSKYEDSAINKVIGHAVCEAALKAVRHG